MIARNEQYQNAWTYFAQNLFLDTIILSNVTIKPTALRRIREVPVSSFEPQSILNDSLVTSYQATPTATWYPTHNSSITLPLDNI